LAFPRLTPISVASWRWLTLGLVCRSLRTCRRQASGGVRGWVFIFVGQIVRYGG